MRYSETRFSFVKDGCCCCCRCCSCLSRCCCCCTYVLYNKYSLSSGASEDASCRHVTRRGCVQGVVRAHHALQYVIITLRHYFTWVSERVGFLLSRWRQYILLPEKDRKYILVYYFPWKPSDLALHMSTDLWNASEVWFTLNIAFLAIFFQTNQSFLLISLLP